MNEPIARAASLPYLRRQTTQLVTAWEEALQLTTSEGSGSELVRVMVRHLADAIDRPERASRPLKGAAHEYAVQRLQAGCDLPQVLEEFRVLRRVVTEQYAAAASVHGEVARDMLPRMFDPFTSGAERRDRRHVGLGLHAVKRIAAAHRGFVHARSSNAMTTVEFGVPCKAASPSVDGARR